MSELGQFRQTTQYLRPAVKPPAPDYYDIYPAHALGAGVIQTGYEALAQALAGAPLVVIDGYPGVLWAHLREQLEAALTAAGQRAHWVDVEQALLAPAEVDRVIAPFLGGADPLFGTRFTGTLRDFFDPAALAALRPDPAAEVNILYGAGAALAGWAGVLVYVDVPKNEAQFRARARSVRNLGAAAPLDPKPAYKRSYFVDWPAANAHKAALLPRVEWIVDEQRPDEPALMTGAALRRGLAELARGVFRVRPWFEPGPWGGQWLKARFPELAQDVPNYAWSFELIVPENGLLFESDGRLLEISFDTLMFQESQAVLGECAPYFKHEFPIRYDFLDTFDGGNLSVQCHPRPAYIRQHFGETFTQDECYYLLDCGPDAQVYLGFQAGLDPAEFKAELRRSARTAAPLEITRFVQAVPAWKHDLILIPNGTIHGAGRDNLVLEISATPYIFTFKMYDWLRLGLDGQPRSLNIDRAFENLYFDRQGAVVQRDLISHPSELAAGSDWRLVHVPTHPQHFYDVHRFEFSGTVEAETGSSCHVMSLVEGQSVVLELAAGARRRFRYAETFVIPAAAGRYRLISEDGALLKVVKTFMKPAAQWAPGSVPDAA